MKGTHLSSFNQGRVFQPIQREGIIMSKRQHDKATVDSGKVFEKERNQFRPLLLSNPNYFGNLKDSAFKPVQKIVSNTSYEELKCVGYNPQLSRLEGVVWVKQDGGYNGGICTAGSQEYVRFYLSYDNGATWLDQGLTSFTVYDVSVTHPLEYAVSLRINPARELCIFNNLPLVRAILSWNQPPTDSNTPPVWGNVLETRIQIEPWVFYIPFSEFLQASDIEVSAQFKNLVDESSVVTLKPPQPLGAGELKALYAKQEVPAHRFLHKELTSLIAHPELTEMAATSASLFKELGYEISKVIAEFLVTDGNTDYEQLDCIGLDPDSSSSDALVGTLQIKRPAGYLGNPCSAGSQEYVGFWINWGNGVWDWAGTTSVGVHDINSIPKQGLNYAVYLPVNLAPHRKPCGEGPVTARVRAILSWNTPPTHANYVPTWGNRLETHILIEPGTSTPVGDYTPYLRAVCGVATCDIDQTTGYAPGERPFGSSVAIYGLIPGAPFVTAAPSTLPLYKVSVQQVPGGVPQAVNDAFPVTVDEQIFPGLPTSTPKSQTAPGDYFTYLDATASAAGWRSISPPGLLAVWNTTGKTGLWQISIEAKDPVTNTTYAAGSLLCTVDGSSRQSVIIDLDQAAPVTSLAITGYQAGGVGPVLSAIDCATFQVGDIIHGEYSVFDEHFASMGLTAEPTASPSAGFTVDGVAGNGIAYPPAPPTGKSGVWTYNTAGLPPCGYTIQLSSGDRTIVGCVTNWENNSAFVGFCLIAKVAANKKP
jgi:hypothetical protein